MEFASKVRAGRAVLSWTRDDLARASGVSAPAIKNIETGASNPTAATQRRVRTAFESEGIFFTADGIEHKEDRIRFLYSFMDVLDDAFGVLKKGDQILFHCADERKNSPEVTDKFKKLATAGIKLRFTIERGNGFITTQAENYRAIDPDFVENSDVSVTYGDKHVLHVRDEGRDVFIVIKNRLMAASRSREFEYWWKTGAACAA